jgi:hypothetical protein
MMNFCVVGQPEVGHKQTLEFYRKRAFEDGLRVGTMLCCAFDKTV